MKKVFSLLLLVAMVLGVASCDNRPNVVGVWQGNMHGSTPGEMKDVVVTFDFGNDGGVTASYLVNITAPLPATDSIIAPYECSITGTSSISGTWQYVSGEDDEIVMNFNPSTITVNVEPDAVVYRANLITDQQAPDLSPLKPALIDFYKKSITHDLNRNSTHMVIKDVEVKNNGTILEFEQNDVDYTFHKIQG